MSESAKGLVCRCRKKKAPMAEPGPPRTGDAILGRVISRPPDLI